MDGIDERIRDTMWSVSINLASIILSGIKLDSSEWILFNYLQQIFGANWPEEHTKPGGYVWVSATLIREQLAALPDISSVSDATLWRRIKRLEDAGLVARYSENQKETKCFLAPGPEAKQFTFAPISKMKEGSFKNEKAPISKMKDNSSINNSNTNTHSSDPLTPLQGETQSVKENEKKKRTTVRRTSTTEQSIAEYAREIDSLKRLPQAVDEAAGARRTKYINLVAWMQKDGRDATVMRMGQHLSFAEYERLHLEYGMTAYQVVCYLERLHEYTDRHKNLTVFGTIRHWWQDDGKRDRRPPAAPPVNGHQQVQSQGTARAPINGTYDR